MMVLRKSLLRLLRTPVKTVLFFLLAGMAAALLSTGGGLWKMCRENMVYFESLFQTIATAEQKPVQIIKDESWDWEREKYTTYNRKEYGDVIPLSVLDFEGADYISGPETRAWYAAYVPDYLLLDYNEGVSNPMIVEASPVEDGIPAGPIKMEIKNILYSYYRYNAPFFNYCDHNNPSPEMMYADKTYIMCLIDGLPHGWQSPNPGPNEFVPCSGVISTQARPDGSRIPNDLSGDYIAEVTPGFYETEEGKHWQALIQEFEIGYWKSVPVTATENTDLIPMFYDGNIFMEQGRGFTEEDYREGKKVCLISRKFARRNEFEVGDILHLPLRSANYTKSAYISGEGYLTAKGDVYPVFEDGYWEICGIYDVLPGGSTKGHGYRMAYNEIIIPKSSMENSDSENIAEPGYMRGYTTSFEIPNGTIEHWKSLWEQQGIDGLEITFYDRGYSVLEAGLKRMNRMAIILLVTGAVSAVCVLIFFCHMFITKQSTRTAIERSLGLSKGQCAASLLSGILLIVLCGCIIGSIGGYYCSTTAAQKVTQVERFDRRYSSGMMSISEDEEATTYLITGDWRVGAVTGSAILVLAAGIAFTMIQKSLKREPLVLLSGREA